MYFEPEVLSKLGKPSKVGNILCGYSEIPSTLENSSMMVAEDSVRHNSSRRGLTWTGGLQFKTGEEIGISLGPIVGLVTDHSARILFETNGASHVNIHLIGRDYFARKQHTVDAKRVSSNGLEPVIVEFTNLKPNYRYTICCDLKIFDLTDAHFRTLPCPEKQARSLLDGPVKIALVSGNDVTYVNRSPLSSTSFTKRYPAQTSDMSLWRDLYERIEDEKIHMVIHLGNNLQIGGCSQTLFQEMVDNNLNQEDAYEIVREEYRKVWNESWCKHVLASCSNIMILSESDIGCLISRPESLNDVEEDDDDVLRITEARIAEASFKAYRKYQQALWGKADENQYSKIIKLNNYLTIMLVDFVGYATNPDAKIQPLNALADLQKIMEPRFTGEQEEQEEVGELPPIGSEQGLLVVSSCSMSDSLSPAHHEALYPTTTAFLSALFTWKTSRAAGEREVMIVSAANRQSGFVHGESTITLQGSEAKIKEWIVGPMVTRQGVALGRGGSWLGFGKASSFARGPFKFHHDSRKATLAYSVLTFGGKLDSPQVDEADAQISREGRIQSVPTFWIEDFVTQAHYRSIVHAFGQFQNKLYVKRDNFISTEHTRVQKALPPFKSRIVWK